MSIKKRKYSLFTNAFDNKFIEAVKHITNFKNANYVKNKPTVYAVASRREHVWEHFPDLNLTELNKLYPKDSIGIRIYYGQNGTERMNYLVFTKENSKSKKGIANDIVSKIYLVDGELKSILFL